MHVGSWNRKGISENEEIQVERGISYQEGTSLGVSALTPTGVT